ncbi:MAG: DUF1592 domain-containing protein [Lentisphaeraceae bacterium]|nr:DUF1592 domain-containing protein [Lentisphaeraceae bacterium]
MKHILLLLCLSPFTLFAESHIDKLFTDYCISCHGPDKQKGKVRLDNLDIANNHKLLESLVAVLEEKEMPPRKKKQPSSDLAEAALIQLQDMIKAKKTTSTLKRLTREEYTNNINDLFKTNFDLTELLPEDKTEHGFNKLGEEQIMSPHQMQSYLKTARFIAQKLIIDNKPKQHSWDFDLKNFRGSKRGDYKTEEGFFLTTNYPWRSNLHFSQDKTSYSRFVIPKFGKYRFDIDLTLVNTKEAQTLGVNLGDPRFPTNFKKIKRIHIPNGTKNISLELTLTKGDQVSFTFDSAKVWRVERKPKAYKGPKVMFTKANITGPIYQEWPTFAQRLILDNTNSNFRALADHLTKTILNHELDTNAKSSLYEFADSLTAKKVTKNGAARSLITAILSSPSFIYKQETEVLKPVAYAERLSYFLWNSRPDSELKNADLNQPKQLKQQLTRMLNDHKAKRFTKDFTRQWLGTDKVDDLSPDERLFPDVYPLQVDAMSKEANAFFSYILKNDLSMVNFIDSDFIMANDQLAGFYDLPKVDGAKFKKVHLPKGHERGGLLGQAGFLKMTSNTFTTSPILRGVWIIKNIYGEKMEPPTGIDIEEPDIRGAKTIKDIIKKHQSTENCYRCHAKIDPLGLALEFYDPVGRYRSEYSKVEVLSKEKIKIEKQVIDATAEMADGRKVNNLSTLKKALLEDKEKIIKGIIGKLITYSTGRPVSLQERPYIDDVYEQVSTKNHSLKEAIFAIVSHESFSNK